MFAALISLSVLALLIVAIASYLAICWWLYDRPFQEVFENLLLILAVQFGGLVVVLTLCYTYYKYGWPFVAAEFY